MEGTRNGCAGELAAGIALPMMADFTTLDKFRRDRRHHQVVAVRTARGGGKGAEEFRPAVMKIHVTASFFSLSVPVVAAHRGNGETV